MSTYPNEPGGSFPQDARPGEGLQFPGSPDRSWTAGEYGAAPQTQQPGTSSGQQYIGQQQYGQQHYGQQPYGYRLPGQPMETGPDDRTMAVLAHLSMIIASVLSAGTLAILGPLLVWLIYKDRSPFVRQAAAGAFNFAIWTVILGVLGWVLTVSIIGAIVGIPMLAATAILSIVFPIIGAVRANRGEAYRYPLTPSFLV